MIYANRFVSIISKGSVNRILRQLKNLKGKKVLDVGCESGFVSFQLIKKGAKVYSFDIFEDPVKKLYPKTNKAKVFLAAAQQMPLKDESFDYVVCTEVIEHMPKVEKAFREMKRVLKKGGTLILTFPNESLRKMVYPIESMLGVNTEYEHQVTLFEYEFKDILQMLKKHFRIEKKYS